MDITRADNFIASLGLESYRVGGSVRDELLGRPVKDADYMIRGVPLFDLGVRLRDAIDEWDDRRVTPSVKPLVLRDGRQAGWRASARGLGALEIVLPRTDVPREPREGENRHRAFDIVIDQDVSLAEDAMRRDFTFNALYLRIPNMATLGAPWSDAIVDPLGRGLYDLSRKLIRTTTVTSFRDDPLRTLRALRFVSVLGYELGTDATMQMTEYAKYVTGLSARGYASGTVFDELSKVLMGDNVDTALRIARDTGVLAALLPELAPMLGFDQGSRYHDLTTDEHTFKALATAAHVGAPLRVRWALLFHDSGKPESAWVGKDGRRHYYGKVLGPGERAVDLAHYNRGFIGELDTVPPVTMQDHELAGESLWLVAARRLGLPAKLRDDVATLIREHMVPTQTNKVGVRMRRERVRLGDEMLTDLLMHRACDISGKGNADQKMLDRVRAMHHAQQEARAAGVPAAVKELKINGHDLADLGIYGPAIGRVLRAVLDEVVCQPDDLRMSREWQLARADALR